MQRPGGPEIRADLQTHATATVADGSVHNDYGEDDGHDETNEDAGGTRVPDQSQPSTHNSC